MSNRERPPDKREGPAAGGTVREAHSVTSRKAEDSAARSGTQRLSDGVAVYAGRVCIGAFVETASGFLVLGPDGRLVQAVAKRAEAQHLLWEAYGWGHRP